MYKRIHLRNFRIMILLIPIAFWLGTVNCYLVLYKNALQSFRRSFLLTFTGLFFFVAIITELLSIFDSIHFPGVTIAWILLDCTLFIWYLQLSKNRNISIFQATKVWYNSWIVYLKQLGLLTQIILASLLLITFIVAVVAPPNNVDSLGYHLSRLGYWMQNKNVEHYASHIERSISFSPLSEYVHLHTFLLLGNERAFQLLQWLSLIGILGFVSLLVETFTKSKDALRIALCFAATLPIVMLEAMTTQNDLVVAFFIISTAFCIFDYIKNGTQISLFLLIATVALGILAKGTYFFYTLPFGLYLLVFLLKNKKWKLAGGLFAGVVLITLIINTPFWCRTYKIFKSPIGNMTNGNKSNVTNINEFLSSTSKHVFLHLGFVSPKNKYNEFLENRLNSFHNWLGIPLNIPGNEAPFKMNKLNFNEDFAHNFFGIWIILLALLILPFSGLSPSARLYFLLSLFSFLVFCFFIGYQIYGSRLHIPFFILISPAIGLIYNSILSPAIQKVALAVLWLNAVPFTILSVTHPLLSTKWFFDEAFPIINKPLQLNIQPDKMLNLKQESILFNPPEKIIWGDQWPEINRLVQCIDSLHARNIGFDFCEASYDYAYQYVLRKPDRHFEHIMLQNPSKILESANYSPDCIIAERDEGDWFTYNKKVYFRKWAGTRRWLYVP